MFRIEMLPAHQGDALWIEYGDSHQPHRLLFDVGTEATWPAVKKRISALPVKERHFELLVVSHVDADHIGGSLPLLEDEELGITFGDVWFNAWRHLPQTLEPMGPVEGERLSVLLSKRKWNKAFGSGPVVVPEDGDLPAHGLPGGMRLTLLSPGTAQLKKLRPAWERAVRAAGLEPGTPPSPPEAPKGLERMGAATPDVVELAKSKFHGDGAAPNGSSIAVLAEFEDRSVILSADGFPTVIAKNVKRLVDERGDDRLRLSALKVPHHGSRANVNLPLLRTLECRHFLFSTNGKPTKHPNDEAVARVLVAAERPRLWFNYVSEYNEMWDRAALKKRYRYEAVYPDDGVEGMSLELEQPGA